MNSKSISWPAATLVIAGFAAIAIAGTMRPTDPYAVLNELTAAGKLVMFTFKDEPLGNVFVAIGQATGLTIVVEAKSDRKISLETGKVPLKDALVQIANEQGLAYEVAGLDRLIVRDRVPRPE